MLSSPLLPHTVPRRYLRERLVGAPNPPPLAPRTNQTPIIREVNSSVVSMDASKRLVEVTRLQIMQPR